MTRIPFVDPGDPDATAREYLLAAHRDSTAASVAAEHAASRYAEAAEARSRAAWYTTRPELWNAGSTTAAYASTTPGYWDRMADYLAGWGDRELRASSQHTATAAYHRAMAGRCRKITARRD
jgi:hypothetical protein